MMKKLFTRKAALWAAFLLLMLLPLIMAGLARANSVMPVWTNDNTAKSLSFNDSFGHNVTLGTYSSTGAWSPSTQSFNVVTYGADPTGVADSTAAINAAVTAAAGQGEVYFPCGTFKITTAISVAVPAGQTVAFRGSGTECTIIKAVGAIGGLVFNYGDQFSSVTVLGMTLTTNQAGVQVGLNFVQPATITLPGYVTNNLIQNVTLRGDGGFQDAVHYWGTGIYLNNVSNTNVNNYFYAGQYSVGTGFGLIINGKVAATSYAVVLNIAGSNFTNCTWGVDYSSYVQGVTITQSNFTGCTTGVTIPAATLGTLDELLISDSQFNTLGPAISLQTNAIDVGISNNVFLMVANQPAIIIGGSRWTINGNDFGSASSTGNTAVSVGVGSGAVASDRGSISGNSMLTMANGIVVASGAKANIGPNTYTGVTTPITDNSGTPGFVRIADFSGTTDAFTADSLTVTRTCTLTGAVSGAGITNLFASPPSIGNTAAGTGAFTTLSASSTVSGTGFTNRFASPGPIGNTAASTGAFTTLSASGLFSPTTQLGVTGGAAGTAGNVGEIKQSTVASGSAVSMTTATAKDITTLALTAGSWQCWGAESTTVGGSTTTQAVIGSINPTTANTISTADSGDAYGGYGSAGAGAGTNFGLSSAVINTSGTPTMHLVMDPFFSVSTLNGFGQITCLRIR